MERKGGTEQERGRMREGGIHGNKIKVRGRNEPIGRYANQITA